MTFSERLDNLLAVKKISGRKLAEQIGVTTGTISAWKNGSYPSADKAVKIAEIFNTTVEYLVNGSEIDIPKKHFLVPILNQQLSAGKGDLLPEDDIVKGFLEIPKYLSKEYGNNLAALYVHGDSMEPTLHNGDIVVATSLGWDSSEGLYAIRMNGLGYVKRLQIGNGKLLVKSDNPRYDTIEVGYEDESFEIIGKIVFIGIVPK